MKAVILRATGVFIARSGLKPVVKKQVPNDLAASEIRYLWSRIACPTFLLHGTDSWVKIPDPAGPLSLFSNYQLKIVEHAGHWVHHDQTALFTTMLKQFVKADGTVAQKTTPGQGTHV